MDEKDVLIQLLRDQFASAAFAAITAQARNEMLIREIAELKKQQKEYQVGIE